MRLLVALCLAALAAGCLEPRPGAPGGEESPPEEPLSLRVEPASQTVEGETAWTITLTVREAVTFTHPGCPPELLRAAVEVDGETVDLYTYGEEPMFSACALREMTLDPGTYERTVQWNGRTEAAAPEPHAGAEAPPGTYPVRARLAATDLTVEAAAEAVVT